MQTEKCSCAGDTWTVEVIGYPGEEFDKCYLDTNEMLEFCGHALYSNALFETCLLRIVHNSEPERESLGYDYDPIAGKQVEWMMKTLGPKGEVDCRLFEATHEAFAMLVAEVKKGRRFIELWGKSHCGPKEPEGE